MWQRGRDGRVEAEEGALGGREGDVRYLVFWLQAWEEIWEEGEESVGEVEDEVEADGVQGVECCCSRVGDGEGS
jgi:hypothetical protein